MPLIHVNPPPIDYDPYELSGTVSGTNLTIVISKGDVLRFDLMDLGSRQPFCIKTSKEKGPENDVSTGISGVGNGKTSGLLIWNTTDIDVGEYYYEECDNIHDMGGRIRVGPTTRGTKNKEILDLDTNILIFVILIIILLWISNMTYICFYKIVANK